jgi:hypothetical protein
MSGFGLFYFILELLVAGLAICLAFALHPLMALAAIPCLWFAFLIAKGELQ